MKTHKTLDAISATTTASAVVVAAVTLPIWIWATIKKVALAIVAE